MANVMDILNNIVNSQTTQDTLAEFSKVAPTKEELQEESKKNTNTKWMLVDGAISLGTMLLNQKRQQQFQSIEQTSAEDAEKALKEREERLKALKQNLGITALEQKLDQQEKTLQDIKSILGQLQAAADQMKKDKAIKVKDLHPAKISKKEVEDEEWT